MIRPISPKTKKRFFDLSGGVDEENYARALYAPHPVLSGMVTRRGLLAAILLFNFVDVLIAVYLTAMRGWPVLVFAGLGLFISVFYVAPPIRLKHIGLGEPGVFLVWGPLWRRWWSWLRSVVGVGQDGRRLV